MTKSNTTNPSVLRWVEEMAKLCQPDRIFWCDGSESEKKSLLDEAVARGILLRLNQKKLPGCYYHRSTLDDVARSEARTFICTPTCEEAGPTNNWTAPAEMYAELTRSLRGRHEGTDPLRRALPDGAARFGTDQGRPRTDRFHLCRSEHEDHDADGPDCGTSSWARENFNRGLHCMLDMAPQHRYIAHFPQDNAIISTGSNYGGNVLLGKKCFALFKNS